MVKKLIINSFIWLIIVGCIAYAVAWALGDPTPTILSPQEINYGNGVIVTLYKLDIHSYLVNLQNTVNIPFRDMFYDFPSPHTPNINNVGLLIPGETYNGFIFAINVLVWIINILVIMPTKLLLHPLMLALSLLGIDTTNLGLVQVANRLYGLNPQPIPYWEY